MNTRSLRSSTGVHRAVQVAVWVAAASACAASFAQRYPITPQQRSTAAQVAQAGVPLAELAANAPDEYTVRSGDTLWDISRLYLRSPWRWPELWGMNLDQIRNPHLIYPGQVLVLDKTGGRARLRVARPGVPGDTVRLSPRIRSTPLAVGPIASIPLHLIAPFLNEAVVFNTNELSVAPRIVATQEGRVVVSRGDLAYALGDFGGVREFRVFREPRPLRDPTTREVLGYEAVFLGTADFTRPGETRPGPFGRDEIVPATLTVTMNRLEIGVGDRLAPVPARDFANYVPHAPSQPIDGQIISVYGEAVHAGQNQIVSLNRGAQDGLARGHVLALWRDGERRIDVTDPARSEIKLPDERHGLLFVFRVFERVSYALILSVQDPVKAGDRFTQP